MELSQERIAVLEALLPEKTHGMGRSAADRTAWTPLAERPDGQKVIQLAESLLDEPLPRLPDELYLEYRKNGTRTNYEQVNDKRLAMMNILALAECLEYKGRFLPKLEVIRSCMRHLSSDGVLIFSTNYTRFKMFGELYEEFIVEDITESTIGADFARNSKIHRCYTR